MEELDEFGIPIKKTSTPQSSKIEMDEFGIPLKKKEPSKNFYEVTSEAIGIKPKQLSQSPLKTAGTTTPSVSTKSALEGIKGTSTPPIGVTKIKTIGLPSESNPYKDQLQKKIEILNQKFGTDYDVEGALAEVDAPDIGTAEAAGRGFLSGVNNIFAAALYTPEYLRRIFTNPIMELAGMSEEDKQLFYGAQANNPYDPLFVTNKLSEYYKGDAEKITKPLKGQFDKDFLQQYEEGDYIGAAKQFGVDLAQSIPATIGIAAATAAGVPQAALMPVGSLVFASQNYQDIDPNSPMSETAKQTNSFLKGFAEQLFENLGTSKLTKQAMALIEREGVDNARAVLAKQYASAAREALKPYFPLTAPLQEGLTEGGTAMAQNVIDMLTDPSKKNINIMDNVVKSTIMGTGMGVAFGGAPTVINTALSLSGKKKAKEIGDKIAEIDKDLDNEKLNDQVKGLLVEERAKSLVDINNVLEAENDKFNELPEEVKTQVQDIQQEISAIDDALSSEITETAKQSLEAKKNELTTGLDNLIKAGATTTDGKGTTKGTVSAGANVAEEGLGMAIEPSSEGITGEGVQAEAVPQAPLDEQAPEVENPNIILSGLSEGFKGVTRDSFDVRSDNDVMEEIRKQKSFAKIITKNGKKYIVVGLYRKPTDNRSRAGGRDDYSFAMVEYNSSTPSDIVTILEGEAKNNFKNIYKDFNDTDIINPITTKDSEISTLEEQKVPEEITNEYLLNTLPEEKNENNTGKVMITTDKFGSTKTRYIPFEIIEQANKNDKLGGQTAKEINDRGGYTDKELDRKLPNWRTMLSKPEVVSEKVTEVTAPAIEVTPTAETKTTTKPVAERIADLRTAEKAEYDAMANPKDKAKRKEIYDKYDKLITPLIAEQKAAEAAKVEPTKETAKPAAKKSKPEQIGEGLLDLLGLAPVEPTEPAKEAGKRKPVNVSNKSELSELESKAQGDKKTIVEAAKKGIATLKSVFPDMEIYIHEDTDSYNETMSEVGGVTNSRGNFAFERDANDNPTGRGRIDINLSNAKDTTVAHELVHAVLLKAFGDNPAVFKAFRDRMSKILRADLNEQVTAFEKLYAGQDVAPEEYLTELAALLSQGGETVEYKPSTLRKVAALINEFVSRITKGKFQPFKSEVDFINFVGFLNQVSGAISEGGVIEDTDTLNGGGEVGTFNFTSKGQLKAPKASEDSRDFIRKLVEDVDIREFNGKKFVTNMYDYTTAGVADLGNGFEINMLGGKNYVPYMMSKKNKAIGDVSNLAAFNTKGQAESFVRNAKKGKAELFAPHSGTLSASWQFQQHTFAELVNLLLDKGIMNNAELINTFNKTIESSQANQKAFEAFKNKYKENIQNFDSFKSDPKEIVKLLDIQNNYSPDLRKALNNAISADKTFQKAIGVKNKEGFFNKIIDPLNKGVTGGELINVVKFDPNTFEIVQTKPDAIDHHPSFGWTLLAKINGIYQPTEFHKSSEVTNSYTKYNKGGASVSRKATEPSYEKTNVSSSAGAIPKIAKLEVTMVSKSQKEAVDKAIDYKKESGTTQVATTTGSYAKAAKILKDMGVDSDVLDYGAGLGLGSDAMSNVLGFDVDSFEPNSERWKGKKDVTFRSSNDINKKYNSIVSLNVLNVVEKDIRDSIVKDIYNNLKDGGTAVISARKWSGDVNQAKNAVDGGEKNSLYITRTQGGKEVKVFQKGFDGNELVDYIKDLLGDNVTVEKNNSFGAAGVIIKKTGNIKSKAQVDVYHGSPYDFDKFTTEKIGTGEGAQAFGWGLYFTDLESIAKDYAAIATDFIGNWNKSSNQDKQEIKERLIKAAKKLNENGDISNDKFNYFSSVIGNKDSDIQDLLSFQYPETKKIIRDFLGNKGSVYKVSLHEGKSPSEYTWLIFDKPVSSEVKNKIIKQIEKENANPETTPFTSSTSFLVEKINSVKTGGELYSTLSGLIYGDKNASLFLLNTGIDGVKYPAESISRGATSETARGFNYVVFDENAVTIKSKAQKAQNDKIKDFIAAKKKAGESDKDIRAGLELVADKLNLTTEDINDLMGVESDEAKPTKGYTPKKKLRRMAERIIFQGKEVPESIAYYTPTTIDAADAKAKELLDELGIDDLVKLISENPEWISIEFFPRVARAAILEINKEQDDIQSKLKKTEDKNLSKRLETLSDMKMMVYGKALPISSRAGLSLSMWKDFSEGIPFDHVREVQRIFELSNEKTKNTFIDVLNKLNLINDNVIEQVAAKIASTVGKSKVEKAKANYESSKRSLKDVWNRSKNVGIAETPWERARKNLQFDKALAKAAKDFVIYKSVQFSQFIKEVSDMLGIAESDIDKDHLKGIFDKVKETQIQKGIKGALSDMEMSLKDLIVDHFTELQETEKSLVDKLKESFGLEEADAQEVASEVSKELRKLSTQAKVKAIKASGLSQGKWVDELLTLSESGSLDFKDIRDEFAKKIGLRELTDEQMKKLEGLAIEMRDEKDPRKKVSLAQDLEDYKHALKTRYGLLDFLVSDYLTNIFASIGSNIVNFVSNFMETTGLLGEVLFKSVGKGNFKDVPLALTQFVKGTERGLGFTKQVILEGKTTYKPVGELAPRGIFEILYLRPDEDLNKYEKFAKAVLRMKFVGAYTNFHYKFWNRLLLSMDSLSGVTNTELGALYKAIKDADKLGLKGQERSTFLNKELGMSTSVLRNAVSTAKELGYEKGSKDYERIVQDLIIEGRSEETKEYSKNYSKLSTLTQEPPPSTMVGAMAAGINSVAKKYKATKFIFPVVNTFANLIIKSIERSPFEFISLGADAMRVKTGNLSQEALSDEEIKRRFKAATVATVAGVALLLMAGGADDEERDFDIFGSGTGDKDLDALLKSKGWKPYSIKFSKNSGYWSFEYTPIGLLLGLVGDLRDLARYKSEEHARLKQMISKKMYKKNYDELDENEKLDVFNEAMSGEYKLDDKYSTKLAKIALTPVKLTGELIKSVGAISKIMSGDVDEGVKYLASTGRGILSPRYGGEIKDMFDNKVYDTKAAWTVLTSNMPFVEVGNVKLDGFGREITKYDREEGAAGLLQGLKYTFTRRVYNPSRVNEIDIFLAKSMVKVNPPSNDLFYTDEKYIEYQVLRGSIAMEKIKAEMDKGAFEDLSPMSIKNKIDEILTKANKKAKKEINETVFRNIK